MIKIISGGQTGIDRMALELAKELGIETGGFVPKGYLTENGPDLTLKEFGLEEIETTFYQTRAKRNIELASGSILFGNVESPGSKLLIRHCKIYYYPFIVNPTSEEIRNYINDLKQLREDRSIILNIAGNRGSKISIDDLLKYREILKWGLIKSGERIEV